MSYLIYNVHSLAMLGESEFPTREQTQRKWDRSLRQGMLPLDWKLDTREAYERELRARGYWQPL